MLAYENQLGPNDNARPFSLTPEREQAVLKAWTARTVGQGSVDQGSVDQGSVDQAFGKMM